MVIFRLIRFLISGLTIMTNQSGCNIPEWRNNVILHQGLKYPRHTKAILIMLLFQFSLPSGISQSMGFGLGLNNTYFIQNSDYGGSGTALQDGVKPVLSLGIYDWKKKRRFSGITLNFQQNSSDLKQQYYHRSYSQFDTSKLRCYQLQLSLWPLGWNFGKGRIGIRVGYSFGLSFHNRSSGHYRIVDVRPPPSNRDTTIYFSNNAGIAIPSMGIVSSISYTFLQRPKFLCSIRGQIGLSLTSEIRESFTRFVPFRQNLELVISKPLFSSDKIKEYQASRNLAAEEREKRKENRQTHHR